jgi:hypothetical protein
MKKIIPIILGIWACVTSSQAAQAATMGKADFTAGVSANADMAEGGKGLTAGHPAGCGCPACMQARIQLMQRMGGQS